VAGHALIFVDSTYIFSKNYHSKALARQASILLDSLENLLKKNYNSEALAGQESICIDFQIKSY
jgi:hypothetical protein